MDQHEGVVSRFGEDSEELLGQGLGEPVHLVLAVDAMEGLEAVVLVGNAVEPELERRQEADKEGDEEVLERLALLPASQVDEEQRQKQQERVSP